MSFTQFAANYQFRTDVVDAEDAIALLSDGTAAAIFLDNEADLSQMPAELTNAPGAGGRRCLVEREPGRPRV